MIDNILDFMNEQGDIVEELRRLVHFNSTCPMRFVDKDNLLWGLILILKVMWFLSVALFEEGCCRCCRF